MASMNQSMRDAFQAGSGVTAKSNDEYELQESNNKLGALVKAIKVAEKL